MSTPEAQPTIAQGSFYPGDVDDTVEAIAQAIRDADDALPLWTEKNVITIGDDTEPQEIDDAIRKGIQLSKGLALLVIGGEEATNNTPEADEPRPLMTVELQLYAARRRTRRPKGAESPRMLCAELAKFLHGKAIRIQTHECWEEITWLRWARLPDDDYIAFSIEFQREMQL